MSTVPTNPSPAYVAAKIGTWQTPIGENPRADELVEVGDAVLDGRETVSLRVAQQTLRYIWRRQKLPHGSPWKQAEDRWQRVVNSIQEVDK